MRYVEPSLGSTDLISSECLSRIEMVVSDIDYPVSFY